MFVGVIDRYLIMSRKKYMCKFRLLANLVAVLYVCEVGGLPEAWGLVQVPQIRPDIGVVSNTLLVALKTENTSCVSIVV